VNLLSAELLSKSYHDRWLFKDLTLGISQGDKLALVGENGAGKSTLLKILTGQVPCDGGVVRLRDGVKVGYLTQEPRANDALAVSDLLFDDSNETARVVRQYEMLIHASDAASDTLQKVLVRMDELNAWDYESKVQEVTGKLGIIDTTQKLGELSGGQRKRVFLAQLLLSNPDMIIMDEPTNHLDLEAIEWLESYLSSQQLTVLMVTHDRYFLDNVAREILELDRGKLYRYKGNYAYFLEKKAEREEMLRTEVTKARNLLRKELEWMRKQPKARGTKAKYRIDAFYELQEKASQNLKRDKLELDIQESRQGGKVLEIDRVSKKYEDKVLVNQFSYVFKKKDRIGVVGKNGIGKSTFLGLITGSVKPDRGEVMKGLTTNIGYFKQEAEDLQLNHRVIEEVKSIAEFITLADGSEVSASRFLDIFLFPPEKQYTFVDKLSGGEKKRLQLLKVLIKNPNFLILDEPTNDFDIDTLNVLEEFLEKFNGCLVLVSHDRYFMVQLVDQLFVFEGEGNIRVFNGNYSDYRLEQDALEQPAVSKPVETKQTASPGEKKKGPSFKERREYEELEFAIQQLELEKTDI
jgi:ATP-binding cassette subfamily F protein uup